MVSRRARRAASRRASTHRRSRWQCSALPRYGRGTAQPPRALRPERRRDAHYLLNWTSREGSLQLQQLFSTVDTVDSRVLFGNTHRARRHGSTSSGGGGRAQRAPSRSTRVLGSLRRPCGVARSGFSFWRCVFASPRCGGEEYSLCSDGRAISPPVLRCVVSPSGARSERERSSTVY